MRIGILGPLEIDDRSARLGTRDRIVLAALAMHPGEVLSVERLADAVWGDEPPPGPGRRTCRAASAGFASSSDPR